MNLMTYGNGSAIHSGVTASRLKSNSLACEQSYKEGEY